MEDIILLDFGIRTGVVNESGEVSYEYYQGAMEFMFEIYEELF